MLSLPRDRPHGFALPALALAKRVAHARPMPIAPRGLHDNASQMGVARLGDPATPNTGPTRVLARHRRAAAVVLLFSLVASGQIELRKIDGWRKIAAVLSQHTVTAA